jgi:hypothetical protein
MTQTCKERESVKRAVRERDGYRCTKCGMTDDQHREAHGVGLHVHRAVPGSLYHLDGCVTLCRGCHGTRVRRAPGVPDLAYKASRLLRLEVLVSVGWLAVLGRAREVRGLSRSAYIRQAVLLMARQDTGGVHP